MLYWTLVLNFLGNEQARPSQLEVPSCNNRDAQATLKQPLSPLIRSATTNPAFRCLSFCKTVVDLHLLCRVTVRHPKRLMSYQLLANCCNRNLVVFSWLVQDWVLWRSFVVSKSQILCLNISQLICGMWRAININPGRSAFFEVRTWRSVVWTFSFLINPKT